MNQLRNEQKKNLHPYSRRSIQIVLIIGITFTAANLRAPLTAVGPLIDEIRRSLHISNTLAGMITTLPLFAFAGFSPFAPNLARKFGTKLVLFWSLIFLTLGIILRSLFGDLGLFLGTVILGLSISVGNVLIPSLIKHEFPERVGVMTGIYTASMGLFGAIASGISVPVASESGLGWGVALSIWAALSFLSIILWIPQITRRKQKISIVQRTVHNGIRINAKDIHEKKGEMEIVKANGTSINKINLWKSPLAWQVTVYMGLQSMLLYCMIAWLPAILVHQGMDSSKAGWMLSLYQLVSLPTSFVGSVLAGRKANQRPLVITASICVLVGLLGIFLGETELTALWMIILGIGGALTFCLALIFFSSRTRNADEAARLSGMAQSGGYLLAAFGPMLFGFLHDAVNNWTLPLIILICAAGLCLLAGLGASRNLYVSKNTSNKATI
ncbi:transporter [Clostridium sp. MF28]|uniref:ABC transporter permease n=1 Tax=Clostridium diolis TaxID=223919 RepID=A0AAV3W2J8_9CLOT|nr:MULTISPECIES: CynX/NimT family MFS transporter [Clostridium]AVK49300.1 transporter [Clostridium sp. MF28]PSM56001.1 MFS transporter [Clostridium diolis]QES71540.1 CynX/NimT family MFS transporter [Clostridium diolis]GEA32642.1 ABC transporter permease [Clostridium diolis]